MSSSYLCKVKFEILSLGALFLLSACGEKEPPKPLVSAVVQVFKVATPVPAGQIKIDFSKTELPSYVVISGLDNAETWGRWSISDRVIFKFGSNLPTRYKLTLAAKAFGPNADINIPIRSGAQEKKIVLSSQATKNISIEFSPEVITDTFEIMIPKPTVPNSGDVRALGVALSSIIIDPI